MMRAKRPLLLALLALLVCVESGRGQDTAGAELLRIGLKTASQEFKLSKLAPELRAAEIVGGVLVGRTRDGEAVVRAARQQAALRLSVSTAFKSLSADVPQAFERVDELLVRYKSTDPGEKMAVRRRLEQSGFTITEDYQKGGFFVVKSRSGIKASMIKALDEDDSVRYAWPNYRIEIAPQPPSNVDLRGRPPFPIAPNANAVGPASVVPNDALWPWMWGMRDIKADQAWRHQTGSKAVVVAVIDTGVDATHPDLKDNMWRNESETVDGVDNDGNGIVDDIHGANFVDPENPSGDPSDDHRHGTHCAGTIAAYGNNDEGVVGVSWQVQIMALKFLGADNSGGTLGAIKCIDYAVDKGANILNNSWGGGPGHPALAEAIERTMDAGVLFVAAAGNEGQNNDEVPHFPASFDFENIIAVASTGPLGPLAATSCYGATSVDIAAPGDTIISTIPADLASDGFPYDLLSGTSMATPHVAGAAALLYSDPNFGNQADSWLVIKTALLANARPLSWLEGKCRTGGTLDLSFLTESSSPTVSDGESVQVPDLVGRSVTFSRLLLRSIGLKSNLRQQLNVASSSDEQSRRVVRQVPEAGKAVSKDSIVTLFYE